LTSHRPKGVWAKRMRYRLSWGVNVWGTRAVHAYVCRASPRRCSLLPPLATVKVLAVSTPCHRHTVGGNVTLAEGASIAWPLFKTLGARSKRRLTARRRYPRLQLGEGNCDTEENAPIREAGGELQCSGGGLRGEHGEGDIVVPARRRLQLTGPQQQARVLGQPRHHVVRRHQRPIQQQHVQRRDASRGLQPLPGACDG
jgi:hypothetical protein